jgi:hypothetical protein
MNGKVTAMKTSITKFLKTRMIQGSLLLALIAAVAASVAWSGKDEGRIKLGGTWVGRSGDITWTASYAPDSSGQNAVTTLQWMTVGADFEGLMGSIGAETMSLVSGGMSMTSKDTAAGKLIWYFLAPGIASTTHPVAGQVKAIAVMTSDWHFASSTTAAGTHNIKLYLPGAQGSLLPEDGVLFMEATYQDVPHQKVF